MQLIIRCFFIFITTLSWGQDLSVSPEILDELETVVVETDSCAYTFRVAYPENYNPENEYKAFLGLSGGGQSLDIVNYCYAAWFRSGYFEDYITILPVAENETANFKRYSPEQIEILLNIINENFKLKPNWVIGGTSNGGIAAFNFVAAFPKHFEGVIVVPGLLNDNVVPTAEWSHLKVILAYGDKDHSSWIKNVKKTGKHLKKIVSSLKIIPLKGQGHILSIQFNVDKFYDPYFLDIN